MIHIIQCQHKNTWHGGRGEVYNNIYKWSFLSTFFCNLLIRHPIFLSGPRVKTVSSEGLKYPQQFKPGLWNSLTKQNLFLRLFSIKRPPTHTKQLKHLSKAGFYLHSKAILWSVYKNEFDFYVNDRDSVCKPKIKKSKDDNFNNFFKMKV